MRLRYAIAALLVLSSSPAVACRCRAASTAAEIERHADAIAAHSEIVATGRFAAGSVEGSRRFQVVERLAGARRTDYPVAVPNGRAFGELTYSGSCIGVEPWELGERVLVLRRRPLGAPDATPYEADACATRFLSENPDALARIRPAAR
jgi:hypothetical protein